MTVTSIPSALVGVLLAGVFVARAAVGVPAAWDYRAGQALAAVGRFADAGPRLDRGAVGADRSEALWRAGRARLEAWSALPALERGGLVGDELLRTATDRFLAESLASPGSAWAVAEIGNVYTCRERVVRSQRVTDLSALGGSRFSLLGDDGRIAIGLTRAAIDTEPNSFEMRDQLVLLLEENGLHEEAEAAMIESARVLPDFDAHPSFAFESLPRDLVEAFWRASRAIGPDDAPLLSRVRQLVSLGQLGRRLGHLEEAEQDFRAALRAPGTRLATAEAAFHLGLVLIDASRLDEAEAMLAFAVQLPAFGPAVAETRARIAEKRGRFSEALVQLREVRRTKPRDIGLLVEFAWIAQKAGAFAEAEEALRWAILVNPESRAPHRALVELYMAQGDGARARRSLADYVLAFGRTEDVDTLEHRLGSSLDRVGR